MDKSAIMITVDENRDVRADGRIEMFDLLLAGEALMQAISDALGVSRDKAYERCCMAADIRAEVRRLAEKKAEEAEAEGRDENTWENAGRILDENKALLDGLAARASELCARNSCGTEESPEDAPVSEVLS